MRRSLMILTVLLLSVRTAQTDETQPAKPDLAAKQYKALIDEFDTDGNARELAGRFIELAEQHPKSPVAVDALVWVVIRVSRGNDLKRATTLLAKDYLKSDRIGRVCRKLPSRPSFASEHLLRCLWKQSPHDTVRATATFHLAVYLQAELSLKTALAEDEDGRPRFEQFYGKEFTDHLVKLDQAESIREVESLYESVIKSFSNFEIGDSALGATSRKRLFAIRHLSLGRPAPEITGQDVDGKTFKLSDYRGRVVLLDFWGHW